MCNFKSEDRISAEERRAKRIKKCLQDRRLQWFGHLEIMAPEDE